MARPALRGFLPVRVSASLLALAGCAAAPLPAPTSAGGDDLPPATRSVDGVTVAVLGDHRPAVARLVDGWRSALEQRDPARLRALVAPTVGGVQQPGVRMSREAWLTRAEAIFASAARARPWLQAPPSAEPYATCAPGCPSALLAPGEWLVRWEGGPVGRVLPGMPSDRALPSTLRVAVVDGEALVVGVDDEIVAAQGPSPARFSGAARP